MNHKRITVAEKQVKLCFLTLDYKLYRSVKDGRDSYDVRITMTNDLTDEADECTVTDVTSIKSEALRIFGLVSDGAVTPTCLHEVLYDLIG